MVELFIQNVEKGMKEIHDGLKKMDFAKVAEHSHSISAPLGQMKIPDLYELSKNIQRSALDKESDKLETMIEKLDHSWQGLKPEIEKQIELLKSETK